MTRLISAPVYRRFETDVWELLGKVPSVGFRARGLARQDQGEPQEPGGSRHPVRGAGLPVLRAGRRPQHRADGGGAEPHQAVPAALRSCTWSPPRARATRHAENDSSRFHGIGSFDKQTGVLEKHSDLSVVYRGLRQDAGGDCGRPTSDVVAVTAAMPDGTGLTHFREQYPERFFDVGIAEQHATTFAAALARARTQAGRWRSIPLSSSGPSTRSSTTWRFRSSTSASR